MRKTLILIGTALTLTCTGVSSAHAEAIEPTPSTGCADFAGPAVVLTPAGGVSLNGPSFTIEPPGSCLYPEA